MNKVEFNLYLQQFFAWWLAGLREWLPVKLSQLIAKRQVILRVDGQELRYSSIDKKGIQSDYLLLADNYETGAPVLLEWSKKYRRFDKLLSIKSAEILVRTLILPLAAKNNLHQIIPFEIERHTPFIADDVYYSTSNIGVTKSKKLSVDLYVIPKALAEKNIAICHELGITIDKLTANIEDKRRVVIPVTSHAEKKTEEGRLFTWLTILSLILFEIWLYQPAMYYEHKREELSPFVEQLKKEAELTREIDNQNKEFITQTNRIIEAQSQRVSVLSVLTRLTELIPTDSWLEKMSIDGKVIHLSGYTPSVSVLVDELAKSNILRNIIIIPSQRFRQNQSDTEYFDLKAELFDEYSNE